MKRSCVAALALAASLLASSSSHGQTPKEKERILGKWETKEKAGDKEVTMGFEFTKAGKLRMFVESVSLEGTYRWVDKDRIEVAFKAPGSDKEERLTLTVKKLDDKELVLAG